MVRRLLRNRDTLDFGYTQDRAKEGIEMGEGVYSVDKPVPGNEI